MCTVLEQIWSTASAAVKCGHGLLQTYEQVHIGSVQLGVVRCSWPRASFLLARCCPGLVRGSAVGWSSFCGPLRGPGSRPAAVLGSVAAAGRHGREFAPGRAAAPAGLERVHPTRHFANLNLQVDGLPFAVRAVLAKTRRDGYCTGRRSD